MVPRLDEILRDAVGQDRARAARTSPPTCPASPRASTATADELVLVSRRHLRSNNSWMHNVKVLVKGKDRCTLLVHPDDAQRARRRRRRAARASRSEAGSVEVPVEVSDEMMPGVVSLPHGWGHDKPGTRLSVAREHAGVNNNVLAPGDLVDALSQQRRGQRHPRRGRAGSKPLSPAEKIDHRVGGLRVSVPQW